MARLEREAVAEGPLDQREEWAVVRVFPAPAYTDEHKTWTDPLQVQITP
jgi:hypothetical protein